MIICRGLNNAPLRSGSPRVLQSRSRIFATGVRRIFDRDLVRVVDYTSGRSLNFNILWRILWDQIVEAAADAAGRKKKKIPVKDVECRRINAPANQKNQNQHQNRR